MLNATLTLKLAFVPKVLSETPITFACPPLDPPYAHPIVDPIAIANMERPTNALAMTVFTAILTSGAPKAAKIWFLVVAH